MTQDVNIVDTQHRALALTYASFIVEAPAGAGKTELLTQRYLSLLAKVHEPEEIIALTFTNKAAAEMRNRILLSLDRAKNQIQETEPHKLKTRELAIAALAQSNLNEWDILSQPSRLRILTIDALCSSLTRQMPLLSKFGGQPRVSDDADVHYAEAARRAIAHIMYETQDDGMVTTALRFMDNNSEKLASLLAKMLARRDQWLPFALHLHNLDAEEITYKTEAALRHLITDYLQSALKVLPPHVQLQLMPLARFAASNLDEDSVIAPLLDWQTLLTADADDLTQWQAVAQLLVTKSERSYRKSVTKTMGFPADQAHKAKKEAFLELLAKLGSSEIIAHLSDLPRLEGLEEHQHVIQALTQLLKLAAGYLWEIFQVAGEVDFVAIAQSAQQALENEQGATDLALKLDYQISHLLIDEFQDTSPVQMKLIKKLIEGWQPDDGRTLFCVGDPMQSIYRFRKAEVSLFLQVAQEGVGHLLLKRLQLSRNNRSHPVIVDWINRSFAQVFPESDNIHQGAISYRNFNATRAHIAGESVTLHPLVLATATDDSSAADQAGDDLGMNIKVLEAEYVANLIVDLVMALKAEQRVNLSDAPKKIAVLVRSRSHLKDLVSEMRRHHPQIKFQAVEIEALKDRQSVQDAFSLVSALHHRADRIHWLNILRAPWCGLTLADLHALAADDHRATVWQLIHDETRLQKISADGLLRLTHLKNVLTESFEGHGRMPTRRWLESTWLRLGGAKCLAEAGDTRDVQEFFDLVEKVSRSCHVDMAALEMGLQKLYAKPDIDAPDTLQFLTIHKSKGLEFDTVILPALNRPPRNADHELVLWEDVMLDGEMHLIAAPYMMAKVNTSQLNMTDDMMLKSKRHREASSSVYQFLKDLEAERSDNEIVRLLYVAATRAQRQLHLIATMQPNKKGELKPAAKSLLKALWPAVKAEFEQAQPYATDLCNNEFGMDIRQFKPQLQRLPINDLLAVSSVFHASTPAVSRSSDQHVQIAQAQNKSFADYLSDLDLSRHCGILAHQYMELFSMSDIALWDSQRLEQCRPAMQQWFKQQGYILHSAEQGTMLVLAALHTTLSSPAGHWVLQQHTQAASELALMQVQDANMKQHVIDRTFIEHGIRWIVDYKLGSFENDVNLSELAEQHRPQLTRYASLFASEALPIKKAVFFLSVGRLIEL